MNKRFYYYSGPVYYFEKCVIEKWIGKTEAVSEKQAKNNLAYKVKKELGLNPNTVVTLPGKLEAAN